MPTSDAELGRYRGIADIHQTPPIKPIYEYAPQVWMEIGNRLFHSGCRGLAKKADTQPHNQQGWIQ